MSKIYTKDNPLKDLQYLIRIFWKIMNDLDVENKGYDVKNWKFEDYNNLLFRLNEIDLNKDEYRIYFRDMVEMLGGFLNEKMGGGFIDKNLKNLVDKKNKIEDDGE